MGTLLLLEGVVVAGLFQTMAFSVLTCKTCINWIVVCLKHCAGMSYER